jgi:hypothetical protein
MTTPVCRVTSPDHPTPDVTYAEWIRARDAALRELIPVVGDLVAWFQEYNRSLKRRRMHHAYRQRQLARRRKGRA